MSVDVNEALNLRINNNLSYSKIGKLLNASAPAVFNAIKPLLPNESTEIYKENRADILAHMQLRTLSAINPSKLKKASARDLVVSTGILYDKERLERGLSTENVSYRGVMDQAKGIDDAIRKLERELAKFDSQDALK